MRPSKATKKRKLNTCVNDEDIKLQSDYNATDDCKVSSKRISKSFEKFSSQNAIKTTSKKTTARNNCNKRKSLQLTEQDDNADNETKSKSNNQSSKTKKQTTRNCSSKVVSNGICINKQEKALNHESYSGQKSKNRKNMKYSKQVKNEADKLVKVEENQSNRDLFTSKQDDLINSVSVKCEHSIIAFRYPVSLPPHSDKFVGAHVSISGKLFSITFYVIHF